MLSRIERCSSEVSCVTIAIWRAQAFLRDAGDVLPVDQDAARFRRRRSRSSRLTSVDLPAPDAPDQADALAGRERGRCRAARRARVP